MQLYSETLNTICKAHPQIANTMEGDPFLNACINILHMYMLETHAHYIPHIHICIFYICEMYCQLHLLDEENNSERLSANQEFLSICDPIQTKCHRRKGASSSVSIKSASTLPTKMQISSCCPTQTGPTGWVQTARELC